MKIVAILLVSLTAITAAPFENVDLVNVRPIEEMPGFWDGRESLKSLIVKTKESSRITNGDEAYPGQFPYMGFILMNLLHGGSFFCGCSLISASRALTAAHCVDEPRIANITVLLGAHDRTISEPSQLIVNVPRLNIIRHPDYDRNTLTNDLCVLRFPRPVEFTNYVYPIELAMNNELEHNLFRNYAASVSGWGLTENWVSSPVLRFIRHSIMPNEYCKETWHHLVTDYHICSNTIAGRSGCNGDSGGPLTVEQYGRSLQAGIVSFGSMDCTAGSPSVYVRISTYRNWILSQ